MTNGDLIECLFVSGHCSYGLFSCLFTLCWIDMIFATPSFFSLHHPIFLYIHISMSSLTSSYLWLSLLFVSSHPSVVLAGWPKSCAVLELCSGRYKLSVALCSHTFPLLSECIHCVHERETETGRQWGLGSREWEMRNGEKEDTLKKLWNINWHKDT